MSSGGGAGGSERGAWPISLDHALRAGSLAGAHRDPFDRILIAQSRIEKLPVVTKDPVWGEILFGFAARNRAKPDFGGIR